VRQYQSGQIASILRRLGDKRACDKHEQRTALQDLAACCSMAPASRRHADAAHHCFGDNAAASSLAAQLNSFLRLQNWFWRLMVN
jgi:hypothetical protein